MKTPEPPDIPGFEFLSFLGSGGSSEVFLFEQQLPRRRVAVKVLREVLKGENRAVWLGEVNAMAAVSVHPNIVTIYAAAIAPSGHPYIVMEYCPGPSFAQRYKSAPFPVELALQEMIRIAGAVETSHRAGILHLDIKPPNILTNQFGLPTLVDFGLASTVRASGNPHLGVSIPWAPPEALGDSPTFAISSDVYSLSATLYTLVSGRSPFERPGGRNSVEELMARVKLSDWTPLDPATVPRSLAAAIYRGMSRRPSERFESAQFFARELQRQELTAGFQLTQIDVMGESRLTAADDEHFGPTLTWSEMRALARGPKTSGESRATQPPSPPKSPSVADDESLRPRIFVVHGHDSSLRQRVVDYLRDVTGIVPTVLSEQPNKGMTIIEKFERHAQMSSVAIVLLSADDVGGPAGHRGQPRARQNVIFEMGYFVGRLGRSRVIPLNAGVEKPSDIDGLLYIPIDAQWKKTLERELEALGLLRDANKE